MRTLIALAASVLALSSAGCWWPYHEGGHGRDGGSSGGRDGGSSHGQGNGGGKHGEHGDHDRDRD